MSAGDGGTAADDGAGNVDAEMAREGEVGEDVLGHMYHGPIDGIDGERVDFDEDLGWAGGWERRGPDCEGFSWPGQIDCGVGWHFLLVYGRSS